MNEEHEQEVSKEEVEQPAEEEAAQVSEPVPAETEQEVSKDVEEGKAFAILSYVLSLIGIPFFLVPLIMRNNEFSLYHAKQCLMIWLIVIVGGVASMILTLLCIGIILGIAVGVFCLVLDIMGIINASNGEQKPLPLIGKLGEEWFKGIKKA